MALQRRIITLSSRMSMDLLHSFSLVRQASLLAEKSHSGRPFKLPMDDVITSKRKFGKVNRNEHYVSRTSSQSSALSSSMKE